MSQKRRNASARKGGYDRFGYRPSEEVRPEPIGFSYQIGRTKQQQLLDKIHFDQLQRSWREANTSMGREGWEEFGNKALPVDRYKHDIMRMLARNRISLLAGETGCGKSTQLAQYALEMGYDHIVYLQPRRVITDAISERLDEELSAQFAEKNLTKPERLVGMAHSDRATLRDDSIIQVMTSAVFKKRAPELEEEWKTKKVLIVADEVHEGNIETEFAIATAAELMTEQKSWNMVLMSATLNENEIQQAYTPINGKPIEKITVEGRPHDIEYYERPMQSVVDVYDEECDASNKTLIFTDGKRSIGAITNELERRYPGIRVLPLHSKITDEQRRDIFCDYEDDRPTVIISTSAGQSGLTIPGVDRVISDGWTKSPELDAENAAGLPRRRCTKAELTQQMGRGGRDVPGAKFFLAQPLPVRRRHDISIDAESFVPFDERGEHIPADIYHSIITRNVLSAAAMEKDFYTLNEYLIHKVTKGTIEEAYAVLKLMGAVDETNSVTDIGREMDKYPLRPELARAVAQAVETGTLEQKLQIAAIAACIEAGGLGSYDPSKFEETRKRLSTETRDDFLAELDYFMGTLKYLSDGSSAAEETNEESLFQAGFDTKNVRRAHKQYRKICRQMGVGLSDSGENLTNTLTLSQREELRRMFLTGMPHLLYDEVGRRKWRGRRKKEADGSKVTPPPTVWYRNVLAPHGTSYDYDREISKRSILAGQALASTIIIAGYPRWYTDDGDNLHNVIERGFATTKSSVRAALGRTATAIVEITEIGPDGKLRLVHDGAIGSLRTYRDKEVVEASTEKRVQLLVAAALERPGAAQRELRWLKRELEDIADRIPQQRIPYFFERPLITQEDLEKLLTQAAYKAGSLGELDANLRTILYTQSYRLHNFISIDNLRSVHENMPTQIEIGGQICDIRYEGPQARPYIDNFSLRDAFILPEQLTIRDGRAVWFRFHYGDDEYRYLTAGEVKEMAQTADDSIMRS